MPGENVLRQLTHRAALYHSGQEEGKWSEKGQPCCYPTVGQVHGIVGLKLSCQVPTHKGCPLSKRTPAVRGGGRWPERDWKNFIAASSPGLETVQRESLPSRELTSEGQAHTGSAGQIIRKRHQANSSHLRGTYPCPSPPRHQNRSFRRKQGRSSPERLMPSHLHALQ